MARQPFYLTKRTLNSGKRMYYFYFYGVFGKRTVPRSTGCRTKSDAFQYCMNLLRTNNLENNKVRFSYYAHDFFGEKSLWYKNNVISGSVKEGTIKGYRNYFNNHIYPYFGDMFIDKISSTQIKEFRIHLSDERELANKTINNIVAVLSIIMRQATEENVILRNPCQFVKKLPVDNQRDAFTKGEVHHLLDQRWDNKDARLVTLTAAITGMRFSEVIGLQPHQIKDGYIDINQQYYDGKITSVKTGENRFITIPKRLEKMLRANISGDFVFTSDNDFTKPYSRTTICRHLFRHYSNDMVNTKDERLLTFHSLRHFANTYFMSSNISPQKVNFVIGHSEGKDFMNALYTSWKPEMYKDLLEVQTKLLDELI